jgi:hypothetical protein
VCVRLDTYGGTASRREAELKNAGHLGISPGDFAGQAFPKSQPIPRSRSENSNMCDGKQKGLGTRTQGSL